MELIKVAIADANILLREGLKRIISPETDLLVAGEAANDDETLDLTERVKPDVLLLDLKIPRQEAVPILLALDQGRLSTKVLIIVNFHSDKESILNTAKAGARGYMSGRILPTTLIQAIRTIHQGEIWVDRQVNCAEPFLELARRPSNDAFDTPDESEISRVLSKRELELLGLVATGLRNEEISKKLFISLRTVKVHLNHIFNKLNVKNRTQAALVLVQGNRPEFFKRVDITSTRRTATNRFVS